MFQRRCQPSIKSNLCNLNLKNPRCLLNQSSACPNTSVFQRFEPLASLCFSLWLILRGPLLSSHCSLQLPQIWCYETRSKVALDMLINSLTHGNEVTSILIFSLDVFCVFICNLFTRYLDCMQAYMLRSNFYSRILLKFIVNVYTKTLSTFIR